MSTWPNGSSRPPYFEVVLRIPLATARIRPCRRVKSVTMRSDSPSFWARSTTRVVAEQDRAAVRHPDIVRHDLPVSPASRVYRSGASRYGRGAWIDFDSAMKLLLIIIGILMLLAGVTWTLQGLDMLGQSGGMNGQKIWAVIGPIVAVLGAVIGMVGLRKRPSA